MLLVLNWYLILFLYTSQSIILIVNFLFFLFENFLNTSKVFPVKDVLHNCKSQHKIGKVNANNLVDNTVNECT